MQACVRLRTVLGMKLKIQEKRDGCARGKGNGELMNLDTDKLEGESYVRKLKNSL